MPYSNSMVLSFPWSILVIVALYGKFMGQFQKLGSKFKNG